MARGGAGYRAAVKSTWALNYAVPMLQEPFTMALQRMLALFQAHMLGRAGPAVCTAGSKTRLGSQAHRGRTGR